MSNKRIFMKEICGKKNKYKSINGIYVKNECRPFDFYMLQVLKHRKRVKLERKGNVRRLAITIARK